MTIQEAIERTDELKFNTYSTAEKILWLSRLDWDIARNILDTHQGREGFGFFGYDQDTDPETVLLAPQPYDQMYLRYLESQIDYHNGENARYNVSSMLFNNQYEAYANYYKRTHLPVSHGRFRF